MRDMSELQIGEFGEYLLTRSLCDEKHCKFYVYGVKRSFNQLRQGFVGQGESKAW